MGIASQKSSSSGTTHHNVKHPLNCDGFIYNEG